MKRRITALLLCAVMCIGLLGVTAFAADAPYVENGVIIIPNGGEGRAEGEKVYVTVRDTNGDGNILQATVDANGDLILEGLDPTKVASIDGVELGNKPDEPKKPAAPDNVKATADGSKITVTWDAVDGADSYKVTWTPGNGEQTVTDNSCTFTVSADGTYTITVVAVNEAGESDPSAAVTVTVTAKPDHDHAWSDAWSHDANQHWHACTVTGCTEKMDATNHTWDNGVVTTQPTATRPGVRTYTCTVCKYERTETIPATGGNTGGNGSSGGGSHGGNVGKPAVVGGNQSSGGNQGGETTGAFSDVQSGAYYADAVQWAVNQGITTGTTSTTFSPNNPCTRAQIVTFLWRANGSPAATGSNPFTDVAQDAYYYDAVLWAVEKGITTGTTATTFSPNNTCTRAQAVTFLHRSAGTPAAGGTNPFTDVGTGAYYTNAVLWAVEKGVTSGTTATTFSPNSTCTRAQIVTFLYRAQ